ncbi:tRNA (adenosine(37)-N6)-threonylcarbamoyltransferase complex ATPase subunit type 1 TsaE [Lentisphaerota bacterium WC36G]|nr:tRNA (adenosine(37)-N6)-threonylcarbamoyltransferase complex ATPase subunit type 1 TsaE [Lentisphaerae bacterium WC36]
MTKNINDFLIFSNSKNFNYKTVNYSFESNSEADTELFAQTLAQILPLGTVITLDGDLGAGKTVFSRGFARGLNITEPISSPTFTIVQEYKLENYSKRSAWFFHLDLYRIDGYHAALAFGIEEFLNEPSAFTLIEWPVRIKELLKNNFLSIKITHINENSRLIILKFIDS